MKKLEKLLFILTLLILLGLTLIPSKETLEDIPISIPFVETEIIDSDISLVSFIPIGNRKASWYGPGFHKKKTANGEIYDQMAFTAAHKSMKFGTLLRITNPKNKKSVVVRINDRGPYIEGRSLDLSKAAALELGMVRKGVMRVKIEEIKIAGVR